MQGANFSNLLRRNFWTNPCLSRRCFASKTAKSLSPVAGIFQGKIISKNLFPYPVKLDSNEKEVVRSLNQTINDFYKTENNAPANDLNGEIPKHIRDRLGELGCCGMLVPEEYSGLGLNNVQYARFCETTGYYDLGIGVFLAAHQSIGYKGILLYGTEDQKQKYLPKLATGQWVASYCLTEPGSGSDAQSIQTKATRDANGNFILEGTKIWISNGGYADFFTVFARLDAKNESGDEKGPLCCFLVEKEFGNIDCSKPEKKMGIKGSNTVAVTFNGTKVPKENLLGEVGQGFHIAVNVLNNGRHGLAAATCGAMKKALDVAQTHANTRKQFGTTIIEFGSIQEKLTNMMVNYYVSQSMSYHIAALIDLSHKADKTSVEAETVDFANESALAKIFGSEAAFSSIDDAIQVLGGMGYMQECELERMMRDMRIFRIFEGTNDILTLLVARNGLKMLGADIKSSLASPMSAIKFMMSSSSSSEAMESKTQELTEELNNLVHPDLSHLAPKVAEQVVKFHMMSTNLLKEYQKDIAKHQYIVYRLGSLALNFYSVLVCLSRCSSSLSNGSKSVEFEKNLVTKAVLDNLREIDNGIKFLSNEHQSLANIPKLSKISLDEELTEPVEL